MDITVLIPENWKSWEADSGQAVLERVIQNANKEERASIFSKGVQKCQNYWNYLKEERSLLLAKELFENSVSPKLEMQWSTQHIHHSRVRKRSFRPLRHFMSHRRNEQMFSWERSVIVLSKAIRLELSNQLRNHEDLMQALRVGLAWSAEAHVRRHFE